MITSTERKPGGSCFADAMFRRNADSKNYAKRMTQRVIQKLYGENSAFGYYEAERFFIITKDNKPLVHKHYHLFHYCYQYSS